MLDILRRLAREPAALLGVATSGLGLAVLFGVPITLEQTGGIVAFVGAVMILLRFVLTPASEVLTQRLPDGTVALGAAAGSHPEVLDNLSGRIVGQQATTLDTDGYVGEHELGRDERGATDLQHSIAVTLLIAAAAGIVLYLVTVLDLLT